MHTYICTHIVIKHLRRLVGVVVRDPHLVYLLYIGFMVFLVLSGSTPRLIASYLLHVVVVVVVVCFLASAARFFQSVNGTTT